MPRYFFASSRAKEGLSDPDGDELTEIQRGTETRQEGCAGDVGPPPSAPPRQRYHTATLSRKPSISARRSPTEVSTEFDALSTVSAAARVPVAASETLPSTDTTRLVPRAAFAALRLISDVAEFCCRIEAAALAARVFISCMPCSMPCTASTAPPVNCCTARM